MFKLINIVMRKNIHWYGRPSFSTRIRNTLLMADLQVLFHKYIHRSCDQRESLKPIWNEKNTYAYNQNEPRGFLGRLLSNGILDYVKHQVV